MRSDLERAIAFAGHDATVTMPNGKRADRKINEVTVCRIADAVIHWIETVPDGHVRARNFEAGLYDRKNLTALVEDIRGTKKV